VSLIARR